MVTKFLSVTSVPFRRFASCSSLTLRVFPGAPMLGVSENPLPTRAHNMKIKYMAMLLAAVLPGFAWAQGAETFQCSYGDLQRRIEILHETESSVPCEVHYYKDTEAPGERQVLWSATNRAGYCEQKTEEFVAQLRGWGWDCGPGEMQEPPPDKADDTEALDSGEDDSGEDE